MGSLEKKYCPDGHSKVDFDLALKQLEESSFLKTGPLVPYTNPPGSSVVAIGSFSKREFIRLTEKGYKAAQKSKTRGSGSETMKVRELVSSIEKFHHDLESHFDLWQQSLGQPLPEYPVRNIQGLKEQVNNVARQLGKLRPYIEKLCTSTKMGIAGQLWDPYEFAISNDVAARKGPSIEAILPQLQQMVGRLQSLNPEATFSLEPAKE